MNITLNRTELLLLPERALYLPEFGILCIADWHLGKAAHFRRSGIAIPQPDLEREFRLISDLRNRCGASAVLFLGDLFHSLKNNDWDQFAGFIRRHPGVDFSLIRGNHDIIPEGFFDTIGVALADRMVIGERILFTHKPLYGDTPTGLLNIAGHIHPGHSIQLQARQAVTLPCYHYSEDTLVLPAFGSMTGLYPLRKAPGHVFYCILGEEVIAV